MSTHATTLLDITAKYAMVRGNTGHATTSCPSSASTLFNVKPWLFVHVGKLDAVEWHVCESVIEYSHPVIGCHHKWSSLEKSTVEKQLSSLIATAHLMC